MLKMALYSVIVCSLITVGSGQLVQADTETNLRKSVNKAEKTFQSRASRLVRQMKKNIGLAKTRARKSGDLSAINQLNSELAEYSENHALPSLIPTLKYRQEMTFALGTAIEKYNRAISKATANDLLELATELARSRDKLIRTFKSEFPRTLIERKLWKHPNGRFEKAGDDVWYEHTPRTRHAFREVDRDADAVYLFDESRNVRIVLSNDASVVKFGSRRARKLFSGKWVN